MAKFTDLPANARHLIRELVTPDNFCYATSKAGRSPTWYFARGGLPALQTATLCGRIRTQHNHGPLIDLTKSAKGHYFSKSKTRRNKIRDFFVQNNLNAAQIRQINAQYRMVPRPGDYHFEYTKTPARGYNYSRMHPSGGQIVLAPRITTARQVEGLITRVLSGPFELRIDNVTVYQERLGKQPTPGLGVAAYLGTL